MKCSKSTWKCLKLSKTVTRKLIITWFFKVFSWFICTRQFELLAKLFRLLAMPVEEFLNEILIFGHQFQNSIFENLYLQYLLRMDLDLSFSYLKVTYSIQEVIVLRWVLELIQHNSAAPLSVALSLFSHRKEGGQRAQRRSCLKGLQRL